MNSSMLDGAMQEIDTAAETTKSAVLTEDFRLGDWLVQPSLNQLQLLEGDEVRHLEPRLAKLLCFLAKHEMQVVDRETLVALLWPKVIVNENSLTRAVSELRKQLAHKSREGKVYIETIPKKGYRLCVPVLQTSLGCPASENSVRPLAAPSPFYYRQANRSVAAAFSLSLVLGFWLLFNASMQSPATGNAGALSDDLVYTPTMNELRDEVVLSSSMTNSVDEAKLHETVVSNDSSRFAFIEYDNAGSTLYLGQANSDFEPIPIFNSQDILFNLAWSPVGNALLFASKPALTTTALFNDETAEVAQLYSFDLDEFTLSVLVEKAPEDLQRSRNYNLT